MNKNTAEDMQTIIKQALNDFYVVARGDTKARMSQLKRFKDHFEAGRGLVFMRDVAKNPEKHFSRAATQAEYNKRLKEECARHAGMTMDDAAYIVLPPADIVVNNARYALGGKWQSKYYNLCHAIQDWEYSRTATKKEEWRIRDAKDKIMKIAREVGKEAAKYKANPVKRLMMNLRDNFTK